MDQQIGKQSPRTCCGVIQETKYQVREKRAQREGPQSWIALKLTIFVAIGIMGYAAYVYIGRFCVPMIRGDPDALGSRALAIVFLVIFSVFYLMMVWTYEKAVITPPGFAKDHVPRSVQPLFSQPPPAGPLDGVVGHHYEAAIPTFPLPTDTSPSTRSGTGRTHRTNTRSSLTHTTSPPIPPPLPRTHSERSHHSAPATHSSQGVPDDIHAPPVSVSSPYESSENNNERMTPTTHEPRRRRRDSNEDGLPPLMYSRHPRTTPILLPEYRYCQRDQLVKPTRAHHCRACGTCVLKYDHHCPWIGQCVGARNEKFFMNFLEWAVICCSWLFSTLLGLNVKAHGDIDPQHIVIIALSGLFLLFCAAMLISHFRLILLNQTTVESLRSQYMKEREDRVLSRLHHWWEFRAKHRTKKQWDSEWGRIDYEGNIWSLGSLRANWEAVMGQKWYEWILPIGRSSGDGLSYPVNPRFDQQGRWRRRVEWPKELQGT